MAINKNGTQAIYSKDTLDEKAFSYSIKNSYRAFRINKYVSFLLNDSLNSNDAIKVKDLLFVQNQSFYFLNKKNTRKVFSTPLQIDYLVLSDNCFLNIESVKANYKYNQLLISSDNDNYHLKIYRKLLEEENIKYLDLSEKAVIIKL